MPHLNVRLSLPPVNDGLIFLLTRSRLHAQPAVVLYTSCRKDRQNKFITNEWIYLTLRSFFTLLTPEAALAMPSARSDCLLDSAVPDKVIRAYIGGPPAFALRDGTVSSASNFSFDLAGRRGIAAAQPFSLTLIFVLRAKACRLPELTPSAALATLSACLCCSELYQLCQQR